MNQELRDLAAQAAIYADPCSLSLAVRAMRERIAANSLAKPEPQPTHPPFQLNRRASDSKPEERVEQRARRLATTMNRRNILFGDPESGTVVRIIETVDGPCPVVGYEYLREPCTSTLARKSTKRQRGISKQCFFRDTGCRHEKAPTGEGWR
ncbi:MAG: hypothetical protein QM739_17875 [Propionivibrio sp.]